MTNDFCCTDIRFFGEDEEFYIPEDCHPRGDTVQFSSPNSCLPKDKLAELLNEIEEANQLLLDLDPDEDNETERPHDRFHQIFNRLRDQFVHINVERIYRIVKRKNRDDLRMKRSSPISGFVRIVGRDFVFLENKKTKVIVPYQVISHIGLPEKRQEEIHHMIDLNPKLRRGLTFNFGEVVSSSPSLILHFFMVDLRFFLDNFETKQVKIISNRTVQSGEIVDTNENYIELKTGRSRKNTMTINYSDIDLLYFN